MFSKGWVDMKTIEIADLHLDAKWLELQKPCLDLILETGRKENVDFFCIAGDIYNRPFYNSEKDKLDYVLDYFEEMLKIAVVVMITGTPAHDAPGSYTIFEKMGCHILKPDKPEIINGVLFFGLPEIDKTNLMARNKMSMEDANIRIEKSINTYIQKYWTPIREDNRDKPCIFLGHGMFVDDINKKNPIVINTDVVIDNVKLKELNADRYIFGHIHQPGESKILDGGYVGFLGYDRTPWNNTGFQPGFNLTEIIDKHIKTTRIDYPVIRKEKLKIVYKPEMKLNLDKYKKCDVRLNMTITKKELKKLNLSELQNTIKLENDLNSCLIVPDIIKEESARITKEQAEGIKTLWDKYIFFKGWHDPAVDGFHRSIHSKINEIEKNISLNTLSQEKKIVKLLSLTVHGSIFSKDSQNKNTFSYDFSKDNPGLTLIAGDNGKGKSTFFGFASPYPIFIGWDYRSLHDFFILDDAYIEKIFYVNGIKHQHLIFILKKKIECFWNIEKNNEWIPYIKASTLSDFKKECETYFGPVDSFISTCFFSQEPHRMKKYISSLVAASSVDLRDAYMAIIGIDRTREKEYAKNKKDELKELITALEIKKNTMNSFIADNDTIYNEKENLSDEVNVLQVKIKNKVLQEREKQTEFDEIEIKQNKQIETRLKIKHKENDLKIKEQKKTELIEKIHEYKNIDIDELKKQLNKNEMTREAIEDIREKWKELNDSKNKSENIIKNIESAIKNRNQKLKESSLACCNIENEIRLLINETSILSEPCEKCNHIKETNLEKIKKNDLSVIEKKESLKKMKNDIAEFNSIIAEREKEIEEEKLKIPEIKLKEAEETGKKLKLQLMSQNKIDAATNQIDEYKNLEFLKQAEKEFENDMLLLDAEIKTLKSKVNLFLENNFNKIKNELQDIKNILKAFQNELSKKSGLLESITAQVKKIKTYEKEITEILKKLDEHVENFSEWEMIEKDMLPNKLPALELELIATEIDFEVNQKLKEKYIIKTDTQYINKKGDVIDCFDIKIYNPQSGIEKSLLAHSPGQRSTYFLEPISQALRERRQKREGVIFCWSVADETDNPIKFTHVFDFYQSMSESLTPDHTRFVMSQKSEIYSFIKNTIDIEKIGINL